MSASVQLTLIGKPDVGRLAFRRAGEVCPAYGRDHFGTGAER
jgi:hypothetical protein